LLVGEIIKLQPTSK